MFDVQIRTDVLKEIVGVISTLVDEAKFNVEPDGVTVRAVDPAHVAMLDLRISPDAFESYSANSMSFAVEIGKLRDVLKLARADDLIDLSFDEEGNRLVARIENLTREMSLLDIAGMTDPKVPQLSLDVSVTIPTRELTRGIRASETVSEHVALSASPDGFEISAAGDRDSAKLVLSKDDVIELKCSQKVRSLFSLEYFSNMVKSIGSSETVTIYLGNDYPMKMAFSIAGGAGEVIYLLAPRIEE